MLAMVGSGEYLPPMDPVDRFLIAQVESPVKVVCLPTAAGTEGAETIRYWSELGIRHFSGLGVEAEAVPVIDRQSANDEQCAGAVRSANFVYISGGKPAYLYDSLKGSRTWEAIQSVLDRGGVVAGCSAGAMIMGERFAGFPGMKNGFNLLPGMFIMPHFDEIPAAMINGLRLMVRNSLAMVGVDGNTALVKNGQSLKVVGSGTVTVWDQKQRLRYTHGQEIPWQPGAIQSSPTSLAK